MGTALARRLVALWVERRSGLAGARLHARMVLLFSVAAVTPTIIVAVFTTLFLNLGINAWFSDRVSTAIKDSQAVAQAYLQEHQQHLGDQALAMVERSAAPGAAADLRPGPARAGSHPSLPAAPVERGRDHRRQRARSWPTPIYNILLAFDLDLPALGLRPGARTARWWSCPIRLATECGPWSSSIPPADTFLYIGRLVDPKALAHVDKASSAAKTYQDLESRRSGFQITFALIFVVVALLVLFAPPSGWRLSRLPSSCGRSASLPMRPSGCAAAIFRYGWSRSGPMTRSAG